MVEYKSSRYSWFAVLKYYGSGVDVPARKRRPMTQDYVRYERKLGYRLSFSTTFRHKKIPQFQKFSFFIFSGINACSGSVALCATDELDVSCFLWRRNVRLFWTSWTTDIWRECAGRFHRVSGLFWQYVGSHACAGRTILRRVLRHLKPPVPGRLTRSSILTSRMHQRITVVSLY